MTTEQVRSLIDSATNYDGEQFFFCCGTINCGMCPFDTGDNCGGASYDFDWCSMSKGKDTELSQLIKYRKSGNTKPYPKLY